MKLTTITIGILPVVFSQELTCGPFQHPLNGECVPNVCNCANGIPVPNSECVTHDSEQCQEVVSDDTTEEESEFACDAGFYCPDGKDRIACPAGSYCPENSVLPIDCPAGTFNVISGVSSIADCAECIEGNYCEAGSEFPI